MPHSKVKKNYFAESNNLEAMNETEKPSVFHEGANTRKISTVNNKGNTTVLPSGIKSRKISRIFPQNSVEAISGRLHH